MFIDLDNGTTKKCKYILENSPVNKMIERMELVTFYFLSIGGNIKASDFDVVATICK